MQASQYACSLARRVCGLAPSWHHHVWGAAADVWGKKLSEMLVGACYCQAWMSFG